MTAVPAMPASSGAPTSTSRRALVLMSRMMLVPHVAWVALRTPKDATVGWERFWGGVRATGVGGDVLWDTGDLDEMDAHLAIMAEHLDTTLPIVDVGSGNGRFTRRLASLFPSAMGVDVSDNAVGRAQRESDGLAEISFRALDATEPDAGEKIRADIGADANVFVRGVLHILEPAGRAAFARTLHHVVGARGRVFLAETNFRGSTLGYLEHLGATARHIPAPLQRAIADLPRPGHFGEPEREDAFPSSAWSVIADGPADVETIPLRGTREPEHIPGYYAVMAARQ